MQALKRLVVQPVMPDTLLPLVELAQNLRWAWHPQTQELFRAIDPELWDEIGPDPVRFLSKLSADRVTKLAADDTYVRHINSIYADLRDYMTGERWYQRYATTEATVPNAIGYFSAEFGIAQALPQYSGGLGILAGDHLKAASDLGVPIIGVGLLYRNGYFRQTLSTDGWQQEHYPVLDPNALPVAPLTDDGVPVQIEVSLRGRPLRAQVWQAACGRVPLLLLDTAVDENPEDLRQVTDRLYGGGVEKRLAQEVLLGIGGVRAIREFCRITGHPEPDVYHANEGHAGFLGLERIREYLEEGHDFDTAVELTRAGNVFTTHTPVPAGIDRFKKELVAEQFTSFGKLPLERILALGAEDFKGGDPSRFNMAVMGFRLGQRANGVSELHGVVSREMFQGLWPGFDESEVPITSITNGVHHRTWIHRDLLELMKAHTSDSDTVIDGYDWNALSRVDDGTLWALKQRLRSQMIKMARERLLVSCRNRGINADWVATALKPNVCTLGFARRGAGYKRLTLMLQDPERLKRLLNDPERPVQIVIAGKSHPADDGGKALIQEMVQFADQPDVRGKLVFLPDYDMSLAGPLYPGCDVWVNNPLRPYEACGTSGMKAALNGAANLSVRDGWWDEWYDPAWGWEIPSEDSTTDPAKRDQEEANFLYEIIENEIVPKFYTRDENGNPTRWLTMVRDTISGLGPKVLASRMVRDYVTKLYTPAATASASFSSNGVAGEVARWKQRVRGAWPGVHIVHVAETAHDQMAVGSTAVFGATVTLGELEPGDVEVQLVVGDVNGDDVMTNVRNYPMENVGSDTDGYRYETTQTLDHGGTLGYTVRVVPSNVHLTSTAELGLATVASG
ncbi:MAG: glycogen phosphorylase [Propionibacteriales bacterium]|nr:MAG: glycogen phosphorylase [Propionibacteriales bacterium]